MNIQFYIREKENPFVILSEYTIDEIIIDSDTFAQENFKSYYEEISQTVTLNGHYVYSNNKEYDDVRKLIDWAILPSDDKERRCYKSMYIKVEANDKDFKGFMREETFQNAYVVKYNELFHYEKGIISFCIVIKNIDEIKTAPPFEKVQTQQPEDSFEQSPIQQPEDSFEQLQETEDIYYPNGSVNFRSSPGSADKSNIIITLNANSELIKVLNEKPVDANGYIWVKVKYNDNGTWTEGWIAESLISKREPHPDLSGLSDREKLIQTAKWYYKNAQSTIYAQERNLNSRNWAPWVIPTALDCSTFTWLVYNTSGVYTEDREAKGTGRVDEYAHVITKEEALPGDLLCCRGGKNGDAKYGHIILLEKIEGDQITYYESAGKNYIPGTIQHSSSTISKSKEREGFYKYARDPFSRNFRFYRHNVFK